jgi:tight adherence protein C
MMLLLLGLLLLGLATAIGARAIAAPRLRASERLAQIGGYGFPGAQPADIDGARTLSRAVDAVAGRLGRVAAGLLPSFSETKLRSRLMAAGLYSTAPTTFLGYQILSAVSFPAAALWLVAAAGSSGAFAVLVVMFAVLAGCLGPGMIVRNRAERRLSQIEAELPELVDLLVLMVEAGIGFSGSIRIASGQLQGALGDELRLTLQEQDMGLSLHEALGNMLSRCETASMRSFVRSVLQGETLGVSIGAIMRNLAMEMRKRRRQAAEERAQKAPIKMLFPLVFLIFPPIFIVLLFPAVHSLGQSLGN